MDRTDIKDVYITLREEMKEKWDRVLPIGELLCDRWEKAEYLGFGNKSSIYDSGIVMGNVVVGEGTWIGPNTLLDGTGGRLEIGNGCDISAGVQVYTHDSVKRCLSGGKVEMEKGDVIIGDYCYIAPMSIVVKGVILGAHSVVAAHSLVKNSFEPYSIIAGVPAKQIGTVVVEDNGVRLVYFKK